MKRHLSDELTQEEIEMMAQAAKDARQLTSAAPKTCKAGDGQLHGHDGLLRRRIIEASDHVTRLKQVRASIDQAVWEAEAALDRLREEAEKQPIAEVSRRANDD